MIALSWCGETGEEKSTFNTTTIAQEYTGPHYSFGSLDACRYSLVGEPNKYDLETRSYRHTVQRGSDCSLA